MPTQTGSKIAIGLYSWVRLRIVSEFSSMNVLVLREEEIQERLCMGRTICETVKWVVLIFNPNFWSRSERVAVTGDENDESRENDDVTGASQK